MKAKKKPETFDAIEYMTGNAEDVCALVGEDVVRKREGTLIVGGAVCHIGDWVVKSGDGAITVYTPEQFKGMFEIDRYARE